MNLSEDEELKLRGPQFLVIIWLRDVGLIYDRGEPAVSYIWAGRGRNHTGR